MDDTQVRNVPDVNNLTAGVEIKPEMWYNISYWFKKDKADGFYIDELRIRMDPEQKEEWDT